MSGIDAAGREIRADAWGPRRWLQIRLFALVFLLFLVYPLSQLPAQSRGERIVTVVGLVAFAVAYAITQWRNVPNPQSNQAPRTLLATALIGAALVPLLGFVWVVGLSYYLAALLLLGCDRRWWGYVLFGVPALDLVAGFAMHAGAQRTLVAALQVLMVTGIQIAVYRQIQSTRELRLVRAELARLAVSEERLRIARDLHDILGQRLSAVALKAELAARLVQRDPDRAAAEMTEVGAVAREALAEVRATVSGYRHASLAGEVQTARVLLVAAGLDTAVRGPVADLPPAVDECAAWLVREAVTNVVRHASAHRCEIEIGRDAGLVTVSVRDDGVRARVSEAVPRGTGLTGLGERVAAAGGTLSVGARDGWFTVCACLPRPEAS